jgi:DNA-binding transcriptional ArsR family regulator
VAKIMVSKVLGDFSYQRAKLIAQKQYTRPPKKALIVIDYEKTERFLKALADKSRLRILECISNQVANPGEIAKKLDRHRSTIEKHLKVLLKAGIIEKVPSLTKAGQLSIRYKVCDNATELLKTILEATQKI